MKRLASFRIVQFLLAAAIALTAHSQDVPPGPQVRIVTAFPTGSGPDAVTRILAEKLAARWHKPVIVDPKPGASGLIAINALKDAKPTGSELVVLDVGTLSINPSLYPKITYVPERDFVPVSMLYKTPLFVVVSARSPIRNINDLRQEAMTRAVTYGSNAVGSPLHLAGAQLANALNAPMVHVPFKETSQLYTSVATGEITWAYGTLATAGPLIQAGKLRVVAVGDVVRSEAMPNVPTLAESGGPKGLEALAWVAILAPNGTDPALAARLNATVAEMLAQPDVKQRLTNFGFALMPGPPQQVSARMKADRLRYADIIRKGNITAN